MLRKLQEQGDIVHRASQMVNNVLGRLNTLSQDLRTSMDVTERQRQAARLRARLKQAEWGLFHIETCTSAQMPCKSVPKQNQNLIHLLVIASWPACMTIPSCGLLALMHLVEPVQQGTITICSLHLLPICVSRHTRVCFAVMRLCGHDSAANSLPALGVASLQMQPVQALTFPWTSLLQDL